MGDTSQNVVTDDLELERKPFFVPRPNPSLIPTVGIFEEPLVCLMINQKWAAHFRGVIDALDQRDTWIGTDEEIEAARQQIREALVQFGNECMICCDEELALLTEIKVLNQTIVTNQTTMIENNLVFISNQETTIEQNTQQVLNTYQNTLNNWVYTNQQTAAYNAQLYDGNPQSIAPTLGVNFETTSTDALCAAIKRYVDNIVTNYTTMANLLAAGSGIVAGVVAAAVIAATLGAAAPIIGAWGTILTGLSFATLGVWNVAAADMEARRKVYCCMYDSLNGQEITYVNFQASAAACGFDSTSSEGRVAKLIDEQSSEANYLSFLRMLGETVGGNDGDCVCDCDDAATLEDFAGTGCVITPMGNCIYRFTNTVVDDIAWYSYHDILDRCLLVENSPDPSFPTNGMSYSYITDCADVESDFTGGHTGGQLKRARWRHSTPVTYLKITLAV